MNLRRLASLILLVPALALAACVNDTTPAGPAETPTSPGSPPAATGMAADAAWLDGGRLLGVVTWGSSSCAPIAEAATASGQEIAVTLTDPGDGSQPCTADFSPRASLVGVPEGVKPQEEVTVVLTYHDETVRFTVEGDGELTGVPGEPTDYAPSAGWFGENDGVVLLTWGSSSCKPLVEDVTAADDAITVTFKANEGACTMDMGPRLTTLGVPAGDGGRSLVLVGDNLDATLRVAG